MIESLAELSKEIHLAGGELCLFYGKTNTILKDLVKTHKIDAVFFNRDYSPYAKARDESVADLCNTMHIECITSSDYYLYEPGSVKTGGGSYYKKFTPFYDLVLKKKVDTPININKHKLKSTTIDFDYQITLEYARNTFYKHDDNIIVNGGRTNSIIQLRQTGQTQYHYKDTRNNLSTNTSLLSAYIKFGCVSIREVYHAIKKQFGLYHGILRELIWREFFVHVLFAYPEVVGQSYQTKYRGLKWHESSMDLKRWKDGKTGFPIVDACMRQLNQTGYMHNRGRMTVASFLIKTLLMDWRLGEAYFAQRLTDYDLASNNGNWQGISGTGVDMKPYFRDMNPWIQQQKYDVDAEFIKKWVPELAEVDTRDIHRWNISCEDSKYKTVNYPKPMVDFQEQTDLMLKMYQS
jgi:deoxyribodipyrimidine photo-lyase